MFKKTTNRSIRMVMLFIIVFIFPPCAAAQNVYTTKPQEPAKTGESGASAGAETKDVGVLGVEDIKAKRAAVEDSGDLGDAVKKSVLTLLDKAIRFRQEASALIKQTKEIEQSVKTAPDRIKEIEAEIQRPQPDLKAVEEEAVGIETGELEQKIRQVEADLSTARTNLNRWTDQLKEQSGRPERLGQEIAGAKERLGELEKELNAAPSPDDADVLIEARRLALLAEQKKHQVEIESYEQQLSNIDALTALMTAERDLVTREVARQEALNKIWQAQAQRLRELEAKKERVEAEQAKEMAVDLPPAVQKHFDLNIKMGKMLEEITKAESEITEKLEGKRAQLKNIEEEFAQAQEQVKYPMHTDAIGLALREQRQALPSIQNYRRDSARRQELMGEIRAVQLDLDRQRRDLADMDKATDEVVKAVENLPKAEIEDLQTEVRRLLGDRRNTLKKLQAGYRRFFKKLQSLEYMEQQISARAEEEARFLDGHLLWIRSAKGIGLADLKNLPGSLKWITDPGNWRQVARDIGWSFGRNTVLWILALLVGAALFGCQKWVRRDMARTARRVGSVHTDSFVWTARVLGLTVWLTVRWPFLLLFTGWQLLYLPFAQDFTRAVGSGLVTAAEVLATLGFLYRICRKEGLAQVHFKWPEAVRVTLRRNLLWLIQLVVPLVFVISAIEILNDAAVTDSLGRLVLIVMMMGLSYFVGHVLRFSGEIVTELMQNRRGSNLARFRVIWYPLAVGIPLVLAVLAGMGYYYSAVALYSRLGPTIWLVLGLILSNSLVLRWLGVTRRRLAFEENRLKREARLAEQIKKQEGDGTPDSDPVPTEEPELGLDEIDEQSRALLRTIVFFSALIGMWAIWSEVLPALNILERIHLWSYQAEVDGVIKTLPITLGHLITGVVIAAITFVAARNLPGVLEITLLKRLPMDAGARYAFSTICRYAISAIGVIVAFNSVGVNWSSLQWLVAALGVGLGFGLQEIVANFVSGLIVLFERPYRVGDVVTVGGVSGTVTRIRIRATTIVNFDRHELIVPNKDFITGQLINWSLSDQVTRIIVPVGIAYGSDTATAEKLLLKVARENPLVLKNPEPMALFLEFGDNSLNFELRVFMNDLKQRMPLTHQLHRSIDDAFRQANIEISFPQRDVHLDQNGPLEVRVLRESSTREATDP